MFYTWEILVANLLFMCRFMEPLTSKVPTMVIEGNHEIEPQGSGITFKSYSERFAVPSSESGSNSNFYYSFDAGGVHFVMLGAYVDYNYTGKSMDTYSLFTLISAKHLYAFFPDS